MKPDSTADKEKPVKVLIVDDSALVRKVLTDGLNADPGIKVVGTAADPYQARDMIIALRPDVLTLDVEMPRMDGLTFLRKLMPQYPMPVVMVSALTARGKRITLEALDAGAVDFVTKPQADVQRGLEQMIQELATKIKIASRADVSSWKHRRAMLPPAARPQAPLPESTDKVIAVGASTGGTEAIRRLLTALPPDIPGMVVVQHMPPGFTATFAERLNSLCALEVKEAETGDRVMTGRVLIAPGMQHMRLVRSGGRYTVSCQPGNRCCGHCPSVDVLFLSVAEHAGSNSIGILLTGMGRDGARGLLALKNAGALTIAQDKESCVVFGMPYEAQRLGAVVNMLPLEKIPERLIHHLRSPVFQHAPT